MEFKTKVKRAPMDKPLLLKVTKFCSLGYVTGVLRDDGLFHLESGHELEASEVDGYVKISDEWADDF